MKNTCISFFLFENFQFLEVKFSIYLNRRIFIMRLKWKNEDADQSAKQLSLQVLSH